jgi:hypothetical protein
VHDVEPADDGVGRPLPTSPTGRLPQWVLDEAAGPPPAAWPPPPQPRARRRGRGFLRGLIVATLVLFLSLGAAVLAGPGPWPWAPATLPTNPATSTPPAGAPLQEDVPVPPAVTAAPDRPIAGIGVASSPRGRPLPPPPEGGPHGFVSFQTDGVTPVGYDPCRLIHYVVRPDGAPAGGEEIVHAAVARISELTGLQFVHDGPTDEAPSRERELFQPDRYGNRWAPVLIAWETEEQNPALAGDIVGEAGSVAVSLGDGPRIYLSGTVSLDGPRLGELLRGRDGEAAVRSVVLHELGHLVGLGHVEDTDQLMYPEARREVTDFAAGDLTGLARLGSGPCEREL